MSSETLGAWVLVGLSTASSASLFLTNQSLWTGHLGLTDGAVQAVYFLFFMVAVVRVWQVVEGEK